MKHSLSSILHPLIGLGFKFATKPNWLKFDCFWCLSFKNLRISFLWNFSFKKKMLHSICVCGLTQTNHTLKCKQNITSNTWFWDFFFPCLFSNTRFTTGTKCFHLNQNERKKTWGCVEWFFLTTWFSLSHSHRANCVVGKSRAIFVPNLSVICTY